MALFGVRARNVESSLGAGQIVAVQQVAFAALRVLRFSAGHEAVNVLLFQVRAPRVGFLLSKTPAFCAVHN